MKRIPGINEGAEFYFSPDNTKLVGDVKPEGSDHYLVHVLNVDGTGLVRINDKGSDACTFFFPDGKRILWTSTRDNLDLPPGDWSKPWDYPQGSELYTSNIDGSDIKRITHNQLYEAEVSVRPDGKYIIFGRQTGGKMDIWRARPDGSEEFQITHHEGHEPGRPNYIPGTTRILYRAWKSADQAANSKLERPKALPMAVYSINEDGTDLRQHTDDVGSNWSAFPAPDGKHFVFAKLIGSGRNYEIFLAEYDSPKQTRLTYNDSFEGMPAISPDGRWLAFSSSRDSTPGHRITTSYLMDISKYHVGPQGKAPAGS